MQHPIDGANLLERVGATDSQRRLLTAIRCTPSCHGLVLALNLVEKTLEAYFRISTLPRVEAWLTIAKGLNQRISKLEDHGIVGLRTRPSTGTTTVFGRLSYQYPHILHGDNHEKALALLGVLVADACSQDRPLNEATIAAWCTLIRSSGSASDWKTLGNNIPVSVQSLNDSLSCSRTPSLQNLLGGLIAAFGRGLQDPINTIYKKSGSEHDPTNNPIGSPLKDELASPGEGSDGGEDDPLIKNLGRNRKRGPLDSTAARENPVGWLIAAANFATHLQKFDLIGDRDRLHPKVTQALWLNLKEDFYQGSDTVCSFVAFAHVSQRLAQPARIALNIPLNGSRSTQLDVTSGAVAWNLRAALNSNVSPALDALEPSAKSYKICRLLDADIADYLRKCLDARPLSTSLAELLGIDESSQALDQWLLAYRKFLREHTQTIHAAYDARHAGSLGDVYRVCTNSDALAFFNALDFDAMPVGIAHYITLNDQFLEPIEKKVFEYLGWRIPSQERSPYVQGSPIYITKEEFVVGWQKCQEAISHARFQLRNALTAKELSEAFNSLACHSLVSLITVTAHRGKCISRLTWRALYQCDELIHGYDKNVGDYQSDRCIPAHKLLDEVLHVWQSDLRLMKEQAKAIGVSLEAQGRRALPQELPNEAVFFLIRPSHNKETPALERKSLRTKHLEAVCQECFRKPLNIGRHFLISELVSREVSTWYIRVLSGHFRIHAEVFSDGMHIPPKQALNTLRNEIDDLFGSLNLATVSGLGTSNLRRTLSASIGDVPNSLDPFLGSSAFNPFRILPPPFDSYSTLAIRVTEDIRACLCSPTTLSAPANFCATLLFFGLLDVSDQAIIFGDWKKAIVLLKDSAVAVWHRPDCSQAITMPLNHRVAMSLKPLKSHEEMPTWREAAEEVARWAKARCPTLNFPGDDFEAFLSLAALTFRYRRYQYSPAVLTASSPALPSAAFSHRSHLRIAGVETPRQAMPSLGKALRQGSSRKIFKTEGPLQDVADALRNVSYITYPIGGEIQRARDWKLKLENVDLKEDLRARALSKLHSEEISLQTDNDKNADESSTLAGHLRDVLIAFDLLSPREDIEDFNEQEWREWIETAKQVCDVEGKNTKAVKENQSRHFGLKRLVRIAQRLGWQAPADLFQDGAPKYSFNGLRKSAASVAILWDDFPRIESLTSEHFNDWPILQRQSKLAVALHKHHPLRSAEQAALVAQCLIHKSAMLIIAPGVFSHLKTIHAYRLLECAQEVLELLTQIQDDPVEANRSYLFLDNSGWDWTDARLIDEALVSAAAQVTGEAAVRKHSLRASAFCRLLWPIWEEVARMLLCRGGTPAELQKLLAREWDRGFACPELAARSAGHGMALIGLVYYSAAWPLMFSALTQSLLAEISPHPSLVASLLGSTGGIRNARSAARASGSDFDIWGEVSKRCVSHLQLPPLSSTDEQAVLLPRNNENEVATPPLLSTVRLTAGLIAGGKRDKLASTYGIPKPFAVELESQIPSEDYCKQITRRKRGEATDHQLSEDRAFMDGPAGQALLNHLATKSISSLNDLLADIAPYKRNPRATPPSVVELQQHIASHLQVLPNAMRLQVRFSRKHGKPLTPEQLHSLGARLIVGPDDPRAGSIPQFQILPAIRPNLEQGSDAREMELKPGQHEQSELVGRLTIVTRIFIEAMLITHSSRRDINL